MSRKKRKYLIETSAVPVAISESTPAHCRHFQEEVGNSGTLHTSVYVRKEFIHRWIMDYIRIAATVDHFSSLSDALYHLNQEFGNRFLKVQGNAFAVLINQKGGIDSCRDAGKEFARLAYWELKKFDTVLRSRIPKNPTGCKLGAKELKVDFNYLFDDLRSFVESQQSVEDCPINEFLGFSTQNSPARRLIEVDDVATETRSGSKLDKFCQAGKWITCKECEKIGDAVIALEQPKTYWLVHIDKEFKILCSATGRDHRHIKSERAVERDVPKSL